MLAHELRYANLTGFVEAHELREKGRARITLRVLTLDDLEPEEPSLSRARDASRQGRLDVGNRRGRRASCNAPAPARADRAGGLRFRAPSLVRAAGRNRLRDQQGRATHSRATAALGSLGLGADRRLARQGQCPHQSRIARRDGRDRGGPHHRRARRHLGGGDAIDARLGPRPHPVDFRPAHGDHGRHGVLAGAGAVGARARAGAALPDQEVGRRRRAGRRAPSISPCLGRRRRPRCAPGS